MKNNLFILILFLPFFACAQENIGDITVDELQRINFTNKKDSILLDVRTVNEYDFSNIANSKNIDVLKTDYFVMNINKLDKSKHYCVICRSGGRSVTAIEKMKELGFKNLTNVPGGMMEWEEKGYPVIKN